MDDTFTVTRVTVKASRQSNRPLRRAVLAFSVLAAGFLLIVSVRWIVLFNVRHRTAAILAKLDRDEPGWRLEQIEAARKVLPAEVNSTTPISAANRLAPARWPTILATGFQQGASPDDPSRVLDSLIGKDTFPEPDEKQIAALRAELAALAPVLVEARKLGDKPEGSYPLVSQHNPRKPVLPQAQATRIPVKILKLDAILKIHDGDFEGAIASSRGILNVARSLGDDPLLLTQLVRISVGAVAIRSIERVLAGGEVSDKSLAVIQALLEDEEAQPTFLWGIRGERAAYNELFSRLAKGEIELDDQKMLGWVHWFAGESMYTYGQGLAVELLSSAVAIPRAKPSEQPGLAQAWTMELAKRYAAGDWDRETARLMPEVALFVDGYLDSKARLRTAIVAIAAERHRLKNGRWPRNLGELTPWPLARVPDDPHTDRPLSMMRLDKDQIFLIYATGKDLVDNAGNLEQSPRAAAKKTPKKRSNRITLKPAWEDQDIGFRLKDAATRRPANQSHP